MATLRSPFLPEAYAAFPALWLSTLLAAKTRPVWGALTFYWPIDWPIDPRLLAVVTFVPQAVILVLVVQMLRNALASASARLPTSSQPKL